MKAKSTLLIAVLFLFTATAFAQIEFEHSNWKQVKAKAKELNKPIFVDAYTTWCGPCKWMSANIFTDEEAGQHFNENFINFKLDMEKGEGLEFAKKYQVRAYPTMLYFDADGEMVHKVVGATRTGQALIQQGKDAVNPETQYAALKTRFEEGEKDPKFLYVYAYTLLTAYESSQEVAAEYLNNISMDQWGQEDNWKFISDHINNYQSETFLSIIENKDIMSSQVGMEAYNGYIAEVLGQAIYMVARGKDEKELARLKNSLDELLADQSGMYMAKADYVFYQRDADKRHEYALAYFDEYEASSQELNSIAWTYYETVDDTEMLEKALEWANSSVEMETGFYNTDTQAHLLMKLKQYAKALEVAAKSVELGKAAGEDVTATQELADEAQKHLEASDSTEGSK